MRNQKNLIMKKNKKIILITGVAGMIGSELLKKMIVKNCLIIGIDNFTLGKKQNIRDYLRSKNFKFFNIDLSKKIENKNILKLLQKKSLDEVWHLAANSDIQKGILNPNVDYRDTFMSTYNLLNFIKTKLSKKTKFIFTSSSAVFGDIKNNINEKFPALYSCSNYGSMKLASEAIISSFSYLNNIKSYIFRLPNVVGKNLTHGVIFDISNKMNKKKEKFLQVLGNGEQCKPYSHASEIIKCIFFTINKKHEKFINYYNIGQNDKGVKVKTIVNLLKNKFKYKKKIRYQNLKQGWKGDVPKYNYSTRKINKLGFKFSLTSLDAIKKSIEELRI